MDLAFDSTVYYRVYISRLFMKYHGLPAKEFVELDTKYHILDLIGDAYEMFHLTGDEGVLEAMSC
jgi:hypothetical protein